MACKISPLWLYKDTIFVGKDYANQQIVENCRKSFDEEQQNVYDYNKVKFLQLWGKFDVEGERSGAALSAGAWLLYCGWRDVHERSGFI